MILINDHYYFLLLYIWIGSAILLFPLLLRITAPYGKHSGGNWGFLIPNRVGWIIMELPALLIFAMYFLTGANEKTLVLWILFLLWTVHYLNRSLLFPL